MQCTQGTKMLLRKNFKTSILLNLNIPGNYCYILNIVSYRHLFIKQI